MVFRKFRLQVVLRVAFLVITLLLIVFTYQLTAYTVSTIILGLLLIAQVIALIRYTEQIHETGQQSIVKECLPIARASGKHNGPIKFSSGVYSQH